MKVSHNFMSMTLVDAFYLSISKPVFTMASLLSCYLIAPFHRCSSTWSNSWCFCGWLLNLMPWISMNVTSVKLLSMMHTVWCMPIAWIALFSLMCAYYYVYSVYSIIVGLISCVQIMFVSFVLDNLDFRYMCLLLLAIFEIDSELRSVCMRAGLWIEWCKISFILITYYVTFVYLWFESSEIAQWNY